MDLNLNLKTLVLQYPTTKELLFTDQAGVYEVTMS